jgi:hypothetical protein
MNDDDGPYVAGRFYKKLFAPGRSDVDSIPHALDEATKDLRRSGVPPQRWATFIHMGA